MMSYIMSIYYNKKIYLYSSIFRVYNIISSWCCSISMTCGNIVKLNSHVSCKYIVAYHYTYIHNTHVHALQLLPISCKLLWTLLTIRGNDWKGVNSCIQNIMQGDVALSWGYN